MLLFALLDTLVGLLLGAHRLHHAHQIARHHISLLLLGSERSLGALQSLFLVLLHASCIFRVFSDGALVGVPEEDALLLRRHVGCLIEHLTFFFDKNGRNGVVDSLCRLRLIVFIFGVFESDQVFTHFGAEAASLLDLVFLVLAVVIERN